LAGLSSRFDIEYYRDPKHRGYLSGDIIANKESPSLFFKPLDAKPTGGKKKGKKAKAANRLF
jgi:large subunit ribosomal protein L15